MPFPKSLIAGLQEFIEAVSFYYYLKNGNVVNIQEVHNPDFLQSAVEVRDGLLCETNIFNNMCASLKLFKICVA